MHEAAVCVRHLTRQGGLADLPRAEDGNNRKRAQALQEGTDVRGTTNHPSTLP